MRILGAQVTLPEPDMMLEAMLEASDPASCFKVYFTKNAANNQRLNKLPLWQIFWLKQIMTIQILLKQILQLPIFFST